MTRYWPATIPARNGWVIVTVRQADGSVALLYVPPAADKAAGIGTEPAP